RRPLGGGGAGGGGLMVEAPGPGWREHTHRRRLRASGSPRLPLGAAFGVETIFAIVAADQPGLAGAGFADRPAGAVQAVQGLGWIHGAGLRYPMGFGASGEGGNT